MLRFRFLFTLALLTVAPAAATQIRKLVPAIVINNARPGELKPATIQPAAVTSSQFIVPPLPDLRPAVADSAPTPPLPPPSRVVSSTPIAVPVAGAEPPRVVSAIDGTQYLPGQKAPDLVPVAPETNFQVTPPPQPDEQAIQELEKQYQQLQQAFARAEAVRDELQAELAQAQAEAVIPQQPVAPVFETALPLRPRRLFRRRRIYRPPVPELTLNDVVQAIEEATSNQQDWAVGQRRPCYYEDCNSLPQLSPIVVPRAPPVQFVNVPQSRFARKMEQARALAEQSDAAFAEGEQEGEQELSDPDLELALQAEANMDTQDLDVDMDALQRAMDNELALNERFLLDEQNPATLGAELPSL